MYDQGLLIWLNLVIQKVNNRPLILGALLGITLTPNHILPWIQEHPGRGDQPEIKLHKCTVCEIAVQFNNLTVLFNLFY